MELLTLRYPFHTVQKATELSLGGCQGWLKEPAAQKSGCGLVAATDLLLYLHRHPRGPFASPFGELPPEGPVPAAVYDYCASRLRSRYFPLLPAFGLNVLVLAAGMNRCFRDCGLPLRARWGALPGSFWQTIHQMLARDIPVILCIGINFPLPWGKASLPLYTPEGESFRQACTTRAHYVTVTGMGEEWLQILSWGRELYIRREELDRYRHRHSCGFYSNILCIYRNHQNCRHPSGRQLSQLPLSQKLESHQGFLRFWGFGS
jgi:hypothetical protein